MEMRKADVLVLGAGIVGVSLAHKLQSSGRQVTVVDLNNVGMGCSYGNAGWMTPCFAMPLPQPGMFFKSIKWMLDPESPLYIKPEANPLLVRWLLYFMKCMNHKTMDKSIEVLTEISKESLKFYKELSQRQSFGFDQKGLLMVSATNEGLQDAIVEMELMAKRGIEGKQLSADEIYEFEPAFKKKVLKGGVYFPREAHAEPLQTVQKIFAEFEAMGGKFHKAEIYDFEFEKDKIKKVMTTQGALEAEVVVMAMGTWSRLLTRKLEVPIPILGGKGYSLIVENFKTKPLHPIMIVEKKLAITPRVDSVRVAGTLELVDQDYSITKRRVDAMMKGAQLFFDFTGEPKVRELWRGLRPCTPDGVPMVGFSKKWKNLFFSAGHQMLGLQSAPGSARLACELILGKTPYVDPEPFAPDRF